MDIHTFLVVFLAVMPFQLLALVAIVSARGFFRKVSHAVGAVCDNMYTTRNRRRNKHSRTHIDRELIASIVPIVRSLMGLDA